MSEDDTELFIDIVVEDWDQSTRPLTPQLVECHRPRLRSGVPVNLTPSGLCEASIDSLGDLVKALLREGGGALVDVTVGERICVSVSADIWGSQDSERLVQRLRFLVSEWLTRV
jgi:hypothetical protein